MISDGLPINHTVKSQYSVIFNENCIFCKVYFDLQE